MDKIINTYKKDGVDYGAPFIWTPAQMQASGWDTNIDGPLKFSVEGEPYQLVGYGTIDGANIGVGKSLDGNYEAVYQPIQEVTVTASPGKSLKTSSGDYANTSDDYYKWRVGTQFANNVNKASLGMMAFGATPVVISTAPLSSALNVLRPFAPDILAGTEIGTGADLAMKLGSGRTYGEWGQHYLSPYLKKYMSPETANIVGDLAGESLNPGGWFGNYKNLANAANTIYSHQARNWNVQSPDYVHWSNLTSQQRNKNNLLNNIHGIIPGQYIEHIINNGAKSQLVDNPLAIYVQRMYNEGFKPTNIKIARTDSDAAKIFANNIIKMRHSNNPATKIQYKTIKEQAGQDVDIDSLGKNELQKFGNQLFYGEGSIGDTEGAFGGIIHYAKNADARGFKRSGYDISGIPENKAEQQTLVHEWEHVNGVPYNPIPEGTISKISLGKHFNYFNNFNNTEVGARIAQILSSFGVTDKSNITGQELKKYFQKYINDPHSIPNNMKLLYNSVLDWDKLANWARNKNNVRSIIGATTIGYSASKNKK